MQYQNILIIDDDVEDQEIFNDAVQSISGDISCTSLTDAREALDKLDSRQLNPEVIFLDLNMPMMNGMDFLRELKQRPHLQDIHVIIFSTSSNPNTISQAKQLGAEDFITKPSRFSDLINVLKPLIK